MSSSVSGVLTDLQWDKNVGIPAANEENIILDKQVMILNFTFHAVTIIEGLSWIYQWPTTDYLYMNRVQTILTLAISIWWLILSLP